VQPGQDSGGTGTGSGDAQPLADATDGNTPVDASADQGATDTTAAESGPDSTEVPSNDGSLGAETQIDTGGTEAPLVDCMETHPVVSGGKRYCEPGRCYCAMPDACFPASVAAACCPGPIMCAAAPLSCTGRGAGDDFERSALGMNWERGAGSNADIVNGRDLGTPDGTWAFVSWRADSFCADQFSEAKIAANKPTAILTQVFARKQPNGVPNGNGARYGFHYNADPGKAWWEIKYDGVITADVRILATNSAAAAPIPGDVLRIEVRGTSPVIIRGFHNSVEVVSAMDSASSRITPSGLPGMVARAAGGSSAPDDSPIFASWRGGELP